MYVHYLRYRDPVGRNDGRLTPSCKCPAPSCLPSTVSTTSCWRKSSRSLAADPKCNNQLPWRCGLHGLVSIAPLNKCQDEEETGDWLQHMRPLHGDVHHLCRGCQAVTRLSGCHETVRLSRDCQAVTRLPGCHETARLSRDCQADLREDFLQHDVVLTVEGRHEGGRDTCRTESVFHHSCQQDLCISGNVRTSSCCHQLGRLVSESAIDQKDPGSNPAADMDDAARNTAWDLGKQPKNYRSNYPTQEWARRFVPIASFYSILSLFWLYLCNAIFN
ncbi:hypothetical protein FHG87_022588 [Trinorchestia longiramus]|nr:hypothetical protein FHG87_022588 [Trinorchestia longiramus]